jgi:hypothetical protein
MPLPGDAGSCRLRPTHRSANRSIGWRSACLVISTQWRCRVIGPVDLVARVATVDVRGQPLNRAVGRACASARSLGRQIPCIMRLF